MCLKKIGEQMRLHKKEIKVLKSTLATLSCDAKLYLFGSRVDDNTRGGDIDLLIVSNKLKKRFKSLKNRIF